MTPRRLDEIEARVNAATPGPWEVLTNIPFYAILKKPAPSLSKHDERPEYWRIEDAVFVVAAREDIPYLLAKLKAAMSVVEFYGDEKKYFMREVTTNLQETTAIFHVEDPSKLPTDFKSQTYECTARLKVDQGKTARDFLKEMADE